MKSSPLYPAPVKPFHIFLFWLILFPVFIFLSGCGESDSIRIGFSGTLTGRYSDIGVNGRSGAELAVEHLNAQGGVAGRKLKLIIRDDGGTPAQAIKVDQELIDHGVVAIIGHMTSGLTMAALPLMEKAEMIMFSPTTSTTDLEGKKDLFFRLTSSTAKEASSLSEYVASRGDVRRVSVLLDADNPAYTERYAEHFQRAFQAMGGRIVQVLRFSSKEGFSRDEALKRVDWKGVDGILLVASSRDAAAMAQQIRLKGYKKILLGVGWGGTSELIQLGGLAVEGMVFENAFDEQATTPAYLAFSRSFQERFGRKPTAFSALSYETLMYLAKALEKTKGRSEGLESALLDVDDFQGLAGPVRLDEYGDVERCTVISMVQNGTKVTLGCVKSH